MKRRHSAWHYTRKILREVRDHPANAEHRVRAVARATSWQVRKRLVRSPVDIAYESLLLRCYPDSGGAANVWYFTSRYDWDQMDFLERYLRPGDGFLDIGANVGTYTLLVASLIGRDARIEAFEALPRAAARLRENVDLNGLTGTTVHEVAVTDHEGEGVFLDFDVSSSLEHEVDTLGRAPIPVALTTLDASVDGSGFAFAKLDVEGVETKVLRGAARLVERHDPPVWLVELYWPLLEAHGSSVAELLALMDDAGYLRAWYDASTGCLDTDPEAWEPHFNCLFIARDRLADVQARLDERPATRAVGTSMGHGASSAGAAASDGATGRSRQR